jgi:predicted dehydrogenase
MNKLRLGLLGTGIAAERLYLPAFEALRGRIEVVACANRTRKKAERYARLARIPKVVDDAEALFALPEVDAVLVSLPIDEQPHYVLAALAAGKAVLSEKPVGPSVADARRLIAKAKRFDVPWLVGENFAFMEHAERLQAQVSAGKLGEIRLVEAVQMTAMDESNPYFHTTWRTSPKFVGGFVVDGGVHVAHVVRRCFGMPEVGTPLTASFDRRLPPLDTVVATLRFPSGALGTWTSCFSVPYQGPLVRVYGSRATAELFWGHLVIRSPGGPRRSEWRETRFDQKKSSFYGELSHFADVVTKGTAPRVPPEEALLDLELLEALVGKSPVRRGRTEPPAPRGAKPRHLTKRGRRG